MTGGAASEPPSAVLRSLFAHAADGIAHVSPLGHVTAANPAFRDLLGLPGDAFPGLDDLLHGDDAAVLASALQAARTGGSLQKGLMRLRHLLSGSPVPVEFGIVGLDAATHGEDGFVLFARDGRARAAAEQELREREAELARVQRIGRVGGFEVDLADGTMRNHRSPEYLRLHGLTEADIHEGHADWARRVHPDDRARVERQVLDAVAGSATGYRAEYRIVTAAGVERWISAVAEIERDDLGRAVRMVGAHIDITSLKAAEAAVRTSEARFRAAVSAVRGIVWTNDAEGRMVGDQPGWAALTGQTPAEYLGFGWSAAVHPDDVAPTLVAWRAAVAARAPVAFVHRVRRHDGAWRVFSVTAQPLFEPCGAAPGGALMEWVGVHTDITEERAAEDALRLLNDELEARVRAEVAAREDTQAQLAKAQRLEALGQLAGGIAHDFNNVLQAVQGAASLIQRRPEQAETVRRLTQMVLDAAKRGASVTRRLLAFSRRGELRAEAIDAAGMLADLGELLTHTIGGGVAVETRCDPRLPPLLADKGQLETVLINLATNARDAMKDGGRLSILAEMVDAGEAGTPDGPKPEGLKPEGLKPGQYVRLSVRDTGVGMDSQTLTRASEPFFTTKPAGAGTGLGLAMARGFATQSGGGLRIDSIKGQGTTVSVWLPVADAAVPVQDAVTAHPAPRASQTACILVTDDDDLVRQTLAENLVSAGFEVVQAHDARAALAVLEGTTTIDLLISDLSMIGLDGISLIREAQRLLPELPAILLTGFASEAAAAVMSSRIRGRFSLLRKPVLTAELCDRIAVLLEGSARQVAR